MPFAKVRLRKEGQVQVDAFWIIPEGQASATDTTGSTQAINEPRLVRVVPTGQVQAIGDVRMRLLMHLVQLVCEEHPKHPVIATEHERHATVPFE